MDGYDNSTTHIRPIVLIVDGGWIWSRNAVTDLVENLKKYSNEEEQCYIKIVDLGNPDYYPDYFSYIKDDNLQDDIYNSISLKIEVPKAYPLSSSVIDYTINKIKEYPVYNAGSLVNNRYGVLPSKLFKADRISYSQLNTCYVLISDVDEICRAHINRPSDFTDMEMKGIDVEFEIDKVFKEFLLDKGYKKILSKIDRPARLYALGKSKDGTINKSILDFVERDSSSVFGNGDIPELAKAVLQYREPVRPPKPKTVMAEVPVFTAELPLLAGAVYDND